MNDILFEILKTTVIVAVIAITRYLVPYLKTKIAATKYSELVVWVEKAVKAAEQTIRESGKGEEKKEKVIEFILDYAFQNNIDITHEQIDALIEAAVKTMKDGE